MAIQATIIADPVPISSSSRISIRGGEQCFGSFVLKTRPRHLRLSNGGRVRARASLNADLKAVGIPHQWYNLVADLSVKPPPPLHPKTFEPVKPEDLSPLFPDELIKQEASTDKVHRYPRRKVSYMIVVAFRAKRLEKLLNTPARIYYKYEGVSPAGSHKPNTAVPQAFYNAQQGIKNVVTETGAGQWGCSLAFACGRWIPSSPGSLGIAISEAVEVAAANADTKYCLGSVLNHVLLHQTVIGEECIKQMEAIGETPDVIIGCTGGGSNFAGLSFPFIREKLNGKINPVIKAVEPAACPSLTKGDMTFIPDPIHSGGLRYHGMAPLISHVYELGFMEAMAIPQIECFQGAIQFARSEGLIPAPEPTHAIAATIREALHCKETGEAKVILMAMCGHGHFDLKSYEKFLQGEMVDLSFDEERIRASLAKVPQVARI
ncbi:TRYPTOPHAN SYNTHASE-RELATED [Salix viminalis]|uniref:tryptophan synthase n=1 Tax=Salix viminalis TaxID=40686 RepID=A0A9Q0SNQ0_SALVM|nr:TRYPTOPHAN SYNTHASE-RELATED [Salix viminalis]